jgi:peptidoglycan-associated lipoprotein
MGKRVLCIAVLGLLVAVVGSGCSSKKKGAGVGADGSKFGEEGIDQAGSLERFKAGAKPGTGEGGPLHDINYAFDSYELEEEARGALRDNASWLKENPGQKVEVEGHCDERGTVEYNLALGAKRARAAKDYLVTLGVSGERLTTISYGEELPLCSEHSESCWSRNRRGHFVVLGD